MPSYKDPLTDEQSVFLRKIYYDEKNMYGYHRLFDIVRKKAETDGIQYIYRAQLKKWLQDQETYQLHKKPPKRLETRSIHAKAVGHMLQVDSVILGSEMVSSQRHHAILTIIDVYSRYAWAFPTKSANATEANVNIKAVVAELKQKSYIVKAVTSDRGTEFSSLQTALGNDVRHVLTPSGSPYRNALVERFNGTLRSWLKRYATSAKNKKSWYLDLQGFVNTYNQSKHRIMKCAPIDVLLKTAVPADSTGETSRDKTADTDNPLQVGSWVRVLASEKSTSIDKNKPIWSEGIYQILAKKTGKDMTRNTYLLDINGKRHYYNSTQLQVITTNKPKTVKHTPNKVDKEPLPQNRRSKRLQAKKTTVKRVPIHSDGVDGQNSGPMSSSS